VYRDVPVLFIAPESGCVGEADGVGFGVKAGMASAFAQLFADHEPEFGGRDDLLFATT